MCYVCGYVRVHVRGPGKGAHVKQAVDVYNCVWLRVWLRVWLCVWLCMCASVCMFEHLSKARLSSSRPPLCVCGCVYCVRSVRVWLCVVLCFVCVVASLCVCVCVCFVFAFIAVCVCVCVCVLCVHVQAPVEGALVVEQAAVVGVLELTELDGWLGLG